MAIEEPRVVEAGRGAAWWSEGWRIFAAKTGTWIGIMVVYFVIAMLIGLVPFVGSFAHSLLTPVFLGGLMLGCQAAERDGSLRVGHLFEGFQGAHFVPLMIVGAVNIAVWLAIMLLGMAGIWGGATMAGMHGMTDPSEMLRQWSDQLTGIGVLGALVVLVIFLVLTMLNWFAPALIVFRGATAIEAMKLSFAASLRNWVPFLVYSAIALAVMIGAAIVIGGVMLVVGMGTVAGGGSGAGIMAFIGAFLLVGAIVIVLALVVGPIVLGSVYAGYKDTFQASEQKLANPAYR
jgi:hypothetical protein